MEYLSCAIVGCQETILEERILIIYTFYCGSILLTGSHMGCNQTILTICFITSFHKHFLVLDCISCTRIVCCNRTGLNRAPCSTIGTLLQFVGGLPNRCNLTIYAHLLAVFDSSRCGNGVLGYFRSIADMHVSGFVVGGINNSVTVDFTVCRC